MCPIWLPSPPYAIVRPLYCSVLTLETVLESLLAGAQKATDSVAVIDVFRAFTTAAVAIANEASHIVMVGSVEEALMLTTGCEF
jgi:phosphosulfolactate phosphohydrolase-like enzyme